MEKAKAETNDPELKRELQSEINEQKVKLREKKREYNAFCEKHGFKRQAIRTHTYKDNAGNTQKSGATSGAVYNYKNDPDGSKRQKIAEDLYTQTRNRNPEYEVKAVAQNSGMDEVDVKKIYDHIYINQHLFQDGTIHLFDPDYEMAQSWQRLRNNNHIQPHDITLLKHELAEYNVMGENLDIAYEPVHNEVVKTYNYQKELIQYLKERGRE